MTNEDYMNNELAELEAMTEKEACEIYNVDYKEEAETYIREYWMYIEHEYERNRQIEPCKSSRPV